MIRAGLLISCEHASPALPARYGRLGLSAAVLRSHLAWDPGARQVGRHLARALGCSCHEGRYSRLLIDLNRSLSNPHLIPARSAAVSVPGNSGISAAERERRVQQYYTPYRTGVVDAIRDVVERCGTCVHVSVHSFVPMLNGVERRADIGLLYDPARVRERRGANWLAESLRAQGLRVRLNYPYRGVNDGMTTHCRQLFPARRYVGLEVEMNQRLLGKNRERRRVARALEASLRGFVVSE